MSKTHYIKILPEYFEKVIKGNKKAELRRNDRDYKIGDKVILKEYSEGSYTGRYAKVKITHLIESFEGLDPDFVVFSFELKLKDSVKEYKRRKKFYELLEFHVKRLFDENRCYMKASCISLYSRGFIYGAKTGELSSMHKMLPQEERRGERAGVRALKRSLRPSLWAKAKSIFKKIKRRLVI